ncbi:MAG: GvpL/GvpF family gas vesicle protein [Actinomycetota bacterium]|nr:GvpL/GvpF family gas vesicle protein [Actinomycetota bacterium]
MPSADDTIARLRAALERVAADEVPELLDQARSEARARVRATLSDAMAQAMLERAQVELEPLPRSRPTPAPSTRAPSTSAPSTSAPRGSLRADGDAEPGSGPELGWYVYCVTVADAQTLPAKLAGVDPAHDVTSLSEGELCALVSQVPLADFDEDQLREHLGDMNWVERIARRHEETLEAIGRLATVIPMRLCSIYRDEAGVRTMLRREAGPMQEALATLQGRSEWGVKVFVTFPIPERGRDDDQAQSGAAYMEQRRSEQRARGEADEQVQVACDAIHGRLSDLAASALIIAPQRPEVSGRVGVMVLNGVYLLDDAALSRFHDTVDELRREFSALGLELEPTGPWPAYNFVPDAIGAAG